MIGYLFLGILLLVAVLFVMRSFTRADPAFLARALKIGGLTLLAAALGFLLVTGRVSIATLILFGIPAALMLHRRYSRLATASASEAPGAGGRSSLETPWLSISLDHDSGAVEGQVKRGRFADRALSSLSVAELVALLAECRADAESASVLEAYLDRVHGTGWRQGGEAGGADAPPRGSKMTREEAYAVLGLRPGAGEEDVQAAYHRLMKKLHPDQGGSDYLAARLNEARDLLLGS